MDLPIHQKDENRLLRMCHYIVIGVYKKSEYIGSVLDNFAGVFGRKRTGRHGEILYRVKEVLEKPGLDGAWLGSFYVITDVIDKESYSNAPCNRPDAAQRVIGGARLVGSPQKRFFSRSSKRLGAGSC
jgi:hypothetical protein